MSREHCAARIQFLASHFGHRLPDETFGQYIRMLSSITPEKIDMAVSNLIQTFIPTSACPFPTISHVLTACGDSPADSAKLAIAKLKICIRRVGQYESISFGDPALHFTVASFGGWSSIAVWTDKEWDVNEGRLLETYKSAKKTNQPGPVYLSGIAEKEYGYFRLHIIHENRKVLCIGHVPPDVVNQLTVTHKKQLEAKHG